MLLHLIIAALGCVNALPQVQSTSEEPCERLSKTVAKWYTDNAVVDRSRESLTEVERSLVDVNFIPLRPAAPVKPSLVYGCLKSMPLDKDTATKYINFLKPLVEWQSTVDYLQDPPQGYLSEGVDLVRGLQDVESALHSGVYQNELDFLLAVQDGSHQEAGGSPSPVTAVDGEPIMDYLLKLSSEVASSHDPDARFNALFSTLQTREVLSSAGKEAGIPGFDVNLPDQTAVQLENGTTVVVDNWAFVRANLTDIKSGSVLYQRYGLGTAAFPPAWSGYQMLARNFTTKLSGFPVPIARTPTGEVAGFLPTGPGLDDVSVISINTFTTLPSPEYGARQPFTPSRLILDSVIETVRAAKSAGRSKMILDLQRNGGGSMNLLSAIYSIFFPGGDMNQMPLLFQARAHGQLEQAVERHPSEILASRSSAGALYPDLVQPDGTPWSSPKEWFGPVEGVKGQNTRQSLDNSSIPSLLRGIRPWTTPPYRPDDIVILTDGLCASACALMVAALGHHHGVRTVAVGGRPIAKPMQAVGGVKGGPILYHSALPGIANRSNTEPPLRAATRGAGLSFNGQNMTPLNSSEDSIPLQFRYEAANCKLFYTWEMTRDMTALWGAVASATWGRGKCVPGSTTTSDGTMGGIPAYSEDVEDRYGLGLGPGSVVPATSSGPSDSAAILRSRNLMVMLSGGLRAFRGA